MGVSVGRIEEFRAAHHWPRLGSFNISDGGINDAWLDWLGSWGRPNNVGCRRSVLSQPSSSSYCAWWGEMGGDERVEL